MIKTFYLLLSLSLFFPAATFAATKVIYADHRYRLGDNDSRNDARRLCLIEAKRSALDKAGTYIESLTEVENLQVTKDEISIYSAAIVKIQTIDEKWKFQNGILSVYMKVKAEIDVDDIKYNLQKIKTNQKLRNELVELRKQLQKKDAEYVELQNKLAVADPSKALSLRKDRNYTLTEMSEIETKYNKVMREVVDRRTRRLNKSVSMGKNMLKYIERDMTYDEVKYILGLPDIGYYYSYSKRRYFELTNEALYNDRDYTLTYLIYDRYIVHFSNSKDIIMKKERVVDSISLILGNDRRCDITIKDENYNILTDGIDLTAVASKANKWKSNIYCDEYDKKQIISLLKKFILQ